MGVASRLSNVLLYENNSTSVTDLRHWMSKRNEEWKDRKNAGRSQPLIPLLPRIIPYFLDTLLQMHQTAYRT